MQPKDYSDALEDFWRAAEQITEDVLIARRRKVRMICLTVVVGLVILSVAGWAIWG